MFSYHRVLAVFGKSVKDKILECDCDIHPWEIKINGKQWPGRIRLIGFADVFFVISYSSNARFEKGIIVYKDAGDIKDLLMKKETRTPRKHDSIFSESDTKASMIEEIEIKEQEDHKTPAEKDTQEENNKYRLHFVDAAEYKVTSWGHEIGLKREYKKSSVQQYRITICKPGHRGLERQIKRAIREHDTLDLMEDLVRCGIISGGKQTGDFFTQHLAGGVLDDTMKKYWDGALANETAENTS